VWKFRGVPDNPSAWLMATARNRAIDVLRRERTARTFAPEFARFLESEWTLVPTVAGVFEPDAIQDDLLRMMFSCCPPRLAEDVQIALILNILCGFSVGEIAAAFLLPAATTQKRIARGKKVLAASTRTFDLSDRDVPVRLSAVQRALYLLFNEGYHGASADTPIRAELCDEALRLARLLIDHPLTQAPSTLALGALFCFHSARLSTRVNAVGTFSPLADQDRSHWDAARIAEGDRLLEQSTEGPEVTEYHLEAAIAAVHAHAKSPAATNWRHIVTLYDALLRMKPTPVVALNRAIAIAERDGPEAGLRELTGIEDRSRLEMYPFYHAAYGALELRLGRRDRALGHFEKARGLARNDMEVRFFSDRVAACR
jgi:predicted RNA polymerase sigma factor